MSDWRGARTFKVSAESELIKAGSEWMRYMRALHRHGKEAVKHESERIDR